MAGAGGLYRLRVPLHAARCRVAARRQWLAPAVRHPPLALRTVVGMGIRGGQLHGRVPAQRGSRWLSTAFPSNDAIDAQVVRVIDESGEDLGALSIEDALDVAAEQGLDLVQVNGKVTPPICRLQDLDAKDRASREKVRVVKKQQQKQKAQSKQVRLSPRTDTGSLKVKAKQIATMLQKGMVIQVFVLAKNHQDRLAQHNASIPMLAELFQHCRESTEALGIESGCWCAAVCRPQHLHSQPA
jgi:translation initiation factor IF-3